MYHPTTRVLAVLELLQARGRLSGPELAERLEVDLRTVRRYVTMLQDLGIPVEAERGRHGGYRLRPGFRLPPLVFSDDEALALTLGLLSARRLGLVTNAATVEGALAKLDRVLPADVRARVSAVQETLTIDQARGQAIPATTTVMALAAAVQEARRVLMRYESAKGEAHRASGRPLRSGPHGESLVRAGVLPSASRSPPVPARSGSWRRFARGDIRAAGGVRPAGLRPGRAGGRAERLAHRSPPPDQPRGGEKRRPAP